MQRRDYAGADDLRAMQELVQRTWGVASRMHLGDVSWERSSVPPARREGWRTALWWDGDDAIAWGWADGENLTLVVDPARPEVAGEVLDWLREVAEAERVECTVLESESHLITALEAAGVRVDDAAPFFTHHRLSTDNLGTPVVPAGFPLRHVRADEIGKRAAVHRAAWSDLRPSKMTDQIMTTVMSTWPYRPELDWVVEAPDGEFVASCLVWLDDKSMTGLVEPVGCAPEYRRRGLAQAVNLGALHALRELGGIEALVCPRGDDGYPQARALYQSIGFRPGSRTVTYVA